MKGVIDKILDVGEFDGYDPEQTVNPNYFDEEYDGEGRDEPKSAVIKAGALFPEDCPMDDKILKSDSAIYAKTILKTISTENGTSLYDHLCTIVRQLIDERVPGNTADYIEELSAQAKLKRYGMVWKDPDSTWKELNQSNLSDADNFLKIWKNNAVWYANDADDEDESKGTFPNLLQTQYYFENINFGFSKEEAYRIALSMGNFLKDRDLENPRFWGKIFCSRRNYYVIEVTNVAREENENDMWVPPRAAESQDFETIDDDMSGDLGKQSSYPTLGAVETLERAGKSVTDNKVLEAYQTGKKDMGVSDTRPPSHMNRPNAQMEIFGEDAEFLGEGYNNKVSTEDSRLWERYQRELMSGFPQAVKLAEVVDIPSERPGSGTNRRAFYVCNDLNENWTLLPLVTPQQINGSRAIRWALTGNLNSRVQTYPPFPGCEGHYLRALLARITAGTLVSPRGYYKSVKFANEDEEDESSEEEEEEEEVTRQVGGNDGLVISPNFRVPRMKYLLLEGGLGWVHHSAMILPQGRTVWYTTKKRVVDPDDNESDLDDEDEGEDSEFDIPQRLVSLPLFTSLGQDSFPDKLSPWSVRSSSEVFTELQIAGVRSNVWPGAVAYCTPKGKMENMYIGDGLKFSDRAWAPHFTTTIQMEYPEGPELRELPDPPIEIEQEWLNAIIEAEAEKQKKIAAAKHVESYYDDTQEDYVSSDEEMETEDEG